MKTSETMTHCRALRAGLPSSPLARMHPFGLRYSDFVIVGDVRFTQSST
ncbi:MAG: hypothetical protein ABI946_11685 [Chthoniobacterales bacterium]